MVKLQTNALMEEYVFGLSVIFHKLYLMLGEKLALDNSVVKLVDSFFQ